MQINICVDILVYFWLSLCYIELNYYLTLNKTWKNGFQHFRAFMFIANCRLCVTVQIIRFNYVITMENNADHNERKEHE